MSRGLTAQNKLFASEDAYDTRMLQLEFSGGNLPAGMMIRESPTLPSHGQTLVRESPTLPSRPTSYRVSSFFDVFTELSLDSGQSRQGGLFLRQQRPSSQDAINVLGQSVELQMHFESGRQAGEGGCGQAPIGDGEPVGVEHDALEGAFPGCG